MDGLQFPSKGKGTCEADIRGDEATEKLSPVIQREVCGHQVAKEYMGKRTEKSRRERKRREVGKTAK